MELDKLKESDAVRIDTRNNFALFDGLRAHQVEPFSGERYSLVFFSINAWARGPRCRARPPRRAPPAPRLAPSQYSAGIGNRYCAVAEAAEAAVGTVVAANLHRSNHPHCNTKDLYLTIQ